MWIASSARDARAAFCRQTRSPGASLPASLYLGMLFVAWPLACNHDPGDAQVAHPGTNEETRMNPLQPFTATQRLIIGALAASVAVGIVQALTWGFGQQAQGRPLERHFAYHRAAETAVAQARATQPPVPVPMALEASTATRSLTDGRS